MQGVLLDLLKKEHFEFNRGMTLEYSAAKAILFQTLVAHYLERNLSD